jgi:cell fate regulator YaaT (PSP1 superfamily)
MEIVRATAVHFKRAGKIYDFLTNDVDAKAGEKVVVEVEKGEDMACVAIAGREIEVENISGMKKVVRVATAEDIETRNSNSADAAAALKFCAELALKHDLQMKLILAEYSLDRNKLTFFYTAENRVDFRQLVKDLAKQYRTRIEMRQIGVRDATKVLGGFGVCGRELCCASFLKKFDNISIKTVKGQNTVVNPNKISGICGRLMCCLVYEKGCAMISQEMAEGIGFAELEVSSTEEEKL